jgi:hypothetical protein
MRLDISIKDDEEKELDPKKDITKWAREVLEKKYKSQKKLVKYMLIAMVIILAIFAWQMNNYWGVQNDLYSTESALGVCTSDIAKNCSLYANSSGESSTQNALVSSVTSFFQWIVHLDQPYFFRLMILLGILYLIQIILACAMDIVEVVLLIFVVIKRLVVWLYHLNGKSENNPA